MSYTNIDFDTIYNNPFFKLGQLCGTLNECRDGNDLEYVIQVANGHMKDYDIPITPDTMRVVCECYTGAVYDLNYYGKKGLLVGELDSLDGFVYINDSLLVYNSIEEDEWEEFLEESTESKYIIQVKDSQEEKEYYETEEETAIAKYNELKNLNDYIRIRMFKVTNIQDIEDKRLIYSYENKPKEVKPTLVHRITINGQKVSKEHPEGKYLRDKDNIVYDATTKEEIGIWNGERIVFNTKDETDSEATI
jgi:hypothetical protein